MIHLTFYVVSISNVLNDTKLEKLINIFVDLCFSLPQLFLISFKTDINKETNVWTNNYLSNMIKWMFVPGTLKAERKIKLFARSGWFDGWEELLIFAVANQQLIMNNGVLYSYAVHHLLMDAADLRSFLRSVVHTAISLLIIIKRKKMLNLQSGCNLKT